MRKLLYIANLRLPTEKAYGIQIAKMCEAFASEDVEVILIYPFRKTPITDDFNIYYSVKNNFKIKMLWAPDFYFPGKLDRASVLLKDFISGITLAIYGLFSGADIIYSRDEWPLYFLSFLKKNLVYESHRFSERRGIFYKRFKNLKTIVITKQSKEDLIKIGFKTENILVAPDGVNLEEFNINLSKEQARTKVGLPPDRKIAMYTGHLFEWKGANVLLETARKLPDVLFVFVGGMEHDIKKFREEAKSLNNVLILGQRPHKEIPAYLKAADVLVLPNSGKEEISRYYTSPLKMFEYMASGRPIVASKLSSISEILNDRNSVLVKPDDVDSLMAGIKKLLDNKAFGEELAKKALEDVQNYAWQKRAAKILDFIIN